MPDLTVTDIAPIPRTAKEQPMADSICDCPMCHDHGHRED